MSAGLAPEIPEDLYHLIKKAVSMRKHLDVNRKDRDGKFRLILVESRIHRLARYYKVRVVIPLSENFWGGCATSIIQWGEEGGGGVSHHLEVFSILYPLLVSLFFWAGCERPCMA